MIIGIAGMVGAGKTTLTNGLSAALNVPKALESVDGDNPWLERFYGESDGMRRHALSLQLHFLATRMEGMRQMRATGGGWILDRTWYEDADIFARGLHDQGYMSDVEFDLYSRLYTELLHSPAATAPDLLVYLDAPLDTILERIGQRGRATEKETPLAYWASLHDRYERWIASFPHCPVLRLDVRTYDLLRDPAAITDVVAAVRGTLALRGTVTPGATARAVGARPTARL
jgi:deoxyadenosine/deoxycytidine kinase